MELTPQQIGPYLVYEEIGRGREVVVFRGRDTLYDRDVALKILPPYARREPERVRSFITAGREAARLRHPHIVEVYDTGQADGYIYMAQRLAVGGTLTQRLATHTGPLDTDEALALLGQLATALDYVHAQSLLHGALHPGNILLTGDQQLLLANVTQASLQDGAELLLLGQGDAFRGQIAYLSPEQARGSTIDARTDLFSLGVLAYRLLTGQLPFQAENGLALLRAIIEETPVPATQHNPLLLPAVDEILLRMLAKAPADRYGSASQFARALAAPYGFVPLALLNRDEKVPSFDSSEVAAESMPSAIVAEVVVVTEPVDEAEPAQAAHFATPPAVGSLVPVRRGLGRGRRLPRGEARALLAVGTLIGLILLLLAVGLLRPSPLREMLAVGTLLDRGLITETAESAITQSTPTAVRRVDAVPTVSATMTGHNSLAVLAEAQEPPPDGQTAAFVPVALTLYEEPAKRYQLSIPAQAAPIVNDEGVQFASTTLPVEFTIYTIESSVVSANPTTLIDTFIAEKLLAGGAEIGDLQVISEGERTLDGRIAYERLVRVTFLGRQLLLRLVALQNEDTGYIMAAIVESEQAASVEALIDAVLGSFRVNEVQAVAVQPPTDTVAPTSTPLPATATPTPSPSPLPTATATPTAEKLAVVGDFPVSSVASQAISSAPLPGGAIAYAIWNPVTDRMDTYIYNIGTGVSWPRLDNARQPDFRYNGELIINSEGGDVNNLVRLLVTGENAFILSDHPEDSRPHWSPSGKKVIYDSTFVGDRKHRIYLHDDVKVRMRVEPMRYDAWELFGRNPIFVADDRVAFNGCDGWANASTCGIQTVDTYGSLPTTVTSWPGDLPTDNLSGRILFMSAREQVNKVDNWDVYVVNVDGSGLQRLTDEPGNDGLATASPDGSHIAFVTDREGIWAVYVMRADGSGQRKLFDLSRDYGRSTQNWEQDWKQERISWGW